MPTYRTPSGAVYTIRNNHGRYRPHYGKKESARFVRNERIRQISAYPIRDHDDELDHVPCEGCGEYGEPNFAGGKRYCGGQFCCP
ncbi:hypothetical protein EJD96_00145 (plasmid) [Herbaspirillum seropedicae]|uniref:hypothetical protein n=1 Tax=Herbaspirillum seropedicae TaxID=964 RepID=UPI00111DED6B|nr:hypothetical protein [Herbaspirillum seropedicae]QDD62663.1 hypothetical protein EJD96_00145 [Herbaspirillum seropedicae]